ncbi:uncharacterized protein LOC128328897 [Hemicordylus capensis]|uniref:uncharacterized protein LOC128328897 n=1 Tax=Hemicordylus capensis TaxID=884348 RepID=UPI0023048177|nr:uncharacterized protein LOC128328897 [Hemicordylus capensis]
MFKCCSGCSLLCVALLLCLGSGVFGTIDPGNLKKVIDYIRKYGTKRQYAVAVRLDLQSCQNPTDENLEAALPTVTMQAMRQAIGQENGLYAPNQLGNIVAARPIMDHPRQHAEFRLLTGGQNSYVSRLLENRVLGSCLVFFSKLSPCVGRCLNQNDARNIVQWLNPLFARINQNAKAFVFELVYRLDAAEDARIMVNAWQSIQNAPLFRWYWRDQVCVKCFDNNNRVDQRCLE